MKIGDKSLHGIARHGPGLCRESKVKRFMRDCESIGSAAASVQPRELRRVARG